MQRQLERQEALRSCHLIPSFRASSRRGLNRSGGLSNRMMKTVGAGDEPSMRSLISSLPKQDGAAAAADAPKEDSIRSLGMSMGMSARLDVYEHQLAMQRSTRVMMEESFAWNDEAVTTAALELACDKLSINPCEPVPETPEERTSLEELAKQAEVQGHASYAFMQGGEESYTNLKDGDDVDSDDENFEMEIAPGYYVPFRGSKEVWRAVNNGNYLECCCLECGTELFCIADAEHVVCPNECCRMVNPVFDRPSHVTTTPYGAGMGLKKEWVRSSQTQRLSYASSA